MSLPTHMNRAAMGQLSDEDLEAHFRAQLAPLIEFLQAAVKFDDGYPDAYPPERRVAGEPYYEHGLDFDTHGLTLEHFADYHHIIETSRGRGEHGRYFEITAWAKEHHWNGDDASLLTLSLFESGKTEFLFFDERIDDDFDAENDILQAMKVILQKYAHETVRLHSFDAEKRQNALARVHALAEIAVEIYNRHFGRMDAPALTSKDVVEHGL